MPNSLVSQLTIPDSNGTGSITYDIKDAQARTDINTLYTLIEGGVEFIGIIAPSPAHQIFDGDTTNPITVKDGASTKSITATAGNIVFQDTNEFIWDGSTWRAFGEATGLKAFAFADTGSTSYTPAGSVSQPTFTGSSSSVTITATDNESGNYQPKGTVSKPTFTGTKVKISGTVTPSGDVSQPEFTGTGVRLVTGNIAVPKTYTTTTATTENKTATVSAASGTATYTPGGTVSQPTFSGDSNNVSISVAADSNGNYTPGGTVSQPTFAGTKVQISGTTTAAGTVSKPSFTGTAATITVTPDNTP